MTYGFNLRWCRWIEACVFSASFSVLTSHQCTPKGFDPAQRVLRLGNPLSQFLFVLVGEALHKMVEAASESDLIKAFKPVNNATIVIHLQFTDDTMIFCDAEVDQVLTVKISFSTLKLFLG